jgi:hypothetical protein
MKGFVPRYVFFLFICLGIFACREETGEQQIGQKYLDSESYREFEEKTETEITQTENQLQGVAEHLEELAECETSNGMSFPFVINQEELTTLLEQSTDCNLGSNNEASRFSLSMLGRSSLQDIDLYWVLVDWQTMYTDQELLAVTAYNDNLRSFKKVGIFNKNLSRDIKTEVRVQLMGANVRITSVANRKILYPIEQDNVEITKYSINPQGTIREL